MRPRGVGLTRPLFAAPRCFRCRSLHWLTRSSFAASHLRCRVSGHAYLFYPAPEILCTPSPCHNRRIPGQQIINCSTALYSASLIRAQYRLMTLGFSSARRIRWQRLRETCSAQSVAKRRDRNACSKSADPYFSNERYSREGSARAHHLMQHE